MLTREKNKLERSLGGIRDMSKVPSAVWVVDTNKEHIAVGEARKLGIPVIAILGYQLRSGPGRLPDPGNDDAIRSAALLTSDASAVAEGLVVRGGAAAGEKPDAEAETAGPNGSRNCWPAWRIESALTQAGPVSDERSPPPSPSRKAEMAIRYTAADVKHGCASSPAPECWRARTR